MTHLYYPYVGVMPSSPRGLFRMMSSQPTAGTLLVGPAAQHALSEKAKLTGYAHPAFKQAPLDQGVQDQYSDPSQQYAPPPPPDVGGDAQQPPPPDQSQTPDPPDPNALMQQGYSDGYTAASYNQPYAGSQDPNVISQDPYSYGYYLGWNQAVADQASIQAPSQIDTPPVSDGGVSGLPWNRIRR